MRRFNAWEDPLVRRRWRIIVAASELGGGVLGAVMLTTQALAVAQPVWHTVGALLFCALSALAGWRLLRGQSGGLGLSVAPARPADVVDNGGSGPMVPAVPLAELADNPIGDIRRDPSPPLMELEMRMPEGGVK